MICSDTTQLVLCSLSYVSLQSGLLVKTSTAHHQCIVWSTLKHYLAHGQNSIIIVAKHRIIRQRHTLTVWDSQIHLIHFNEQLGQQSKPNHLCCKDTECWNFFPLHRHIAISAHVLTSNLSHNTCAPIAIIWMQFGLCFHFPPVDTSGAVAVVVGNALTSLSPFLNVLLCDLVQSNLTGTGTSACALIWKYAQLCASCFVNGNWWCLKNMHKVPSEVNKQAVTWCRMWKCSKRHLTCSSIEY